MNNRERFIVYGLLSLLCVFNVTMLLGSNNQTVWAQETPEQKELEQLGPAQSLTLAGEDASDKPVELRNRKEHLSWGDEPYHSAYSVAFVHVGKPLFRLLASESYQEPITELREELTAEAQQRDQELRELYEEIQEAGQDSPQFPELQQQFNQLRQQAQEWQLLAQRRVAKMEADALMRAYDEIVAAVDVVSEQRNIDLVLRFLPLDMEEEELGIDTPDQAQAVIRGRTALKYPEAIDITNAVMEELSLAIE